MEISSKKSQSFSMRLPTDVLDAVNDLAEKQNATRTQVIVSVLRNFLGTLRDDAELLSLIPGQGVSVKEISFAKLFDDAGLLVESSLTPSGYPAVFFSMPFGNGVYRMTHLMGSLTERNKLFSLVDARFASRFVDEFDGIYSVEDAAFEYGREFSHISNLINSLLDAPESGADTF